MSQIIRFIYKNTIIGGQWNQFVEVDYINVGYGVVFHVAAMVSRRINYVPYELSNIVSKDTHRPLSLCFKHILVWVRIMYICITMLFVWFADFVLFFRLKRLMVSFDCYSNDSLRLETSLRPSTFLRKFYRYIMLLMKELCIR